MGMLKSNTQDVFRAVKRRKIVVLPGFKNEKTHQTMLCKINKNHLKKQTTCLIVLMSYVV